MKESSDRAQFAENKATALEARVAESSALALEAAAHAAGKVEEQAALRQYEADVLALELQNLKNRLAIHDSDALEAENQALRTAVSQLQVPPQTLPAQPVLAFRNRLRIRGAPHPMDAVCMHD